MDEGWNVTPEGWVGVGALVLAAWAAWEARPREPEGDWAGIFRWMTGGLDGPPGVAPGLASSWDEVRNWSDGTRAAIRRRFERTVLVAVGTDWGGALGAAVDGVRCVGVDAADGELLVRAIEEALPMRSDRMIVVTGGAGTLCAMKVLHANPGLRDRLQAVVHVGGTLTDAWWRTEFTHEGMDVESNRSVPYFSISDASLPDGDQSFPSPPVPSSGRRAIDAIPLGSLPLADVPVSDVQRGVVARAIWTVLAARLAS